MDGKNNEGLDDYPQPVGWGPSVTPTYGLTPLWMRCSVNWMETGA